jgi:hypothetical protein
MPTMLARCPVCEGDLKISEVRCDRCGTKVQSTFDPCRFCSVPAEHLAFIEVFLRCEGNLSRVEKDLGVSYPTVRNRLTAALSALGLAPNGPDTAQPPPAPAPEPAVQPPPEDTSARRRDVLNALARGEINPDEAAKVLRDLS